VRWIGQTGTTHGQRQHPASQESHKHQRNYHPNPIKA
jgi:hypothetical protein